MDSRKHTRHPGGRLILGGFLWVISIVTPTGIAAVQVAAPTSLPVPKQFQNGIASSPPALATLNPDPEVNAEQPPAAAPPDPPARYPRFLLNSYIGVQLGSIGYAFSNAQAQPGFHAQSIQIPHLAARVVLFGHEFHKYFSAQISDMRPVYWVNYQDVNGDQASHTVWMNIAGLTAKARLPLTGKWSLYAEGGLGIVTRKGFGIGPATVVSDASYATLLFGGGLEYRLNSNWALLSGVIAAPGRSAVRQPSTVFFSAGFTYTLRRLPAELVETEPAIGPLWPKNTLQLGYISNVLGYGVNNFVSKGAVPVFWPGSVEVANGLSLDYRREVFHTRRYFALDWGASVSSWKSRKNGERFYTAAVYPELRFILVRTNPLELYFAYSLAGPALITRANIDGTDTGRTFTFQDFMSAGVLLGRNRKIAAEVRIAHYSNADLFPQNPGVTIPLGLYLGSTFR